ncbi:acetyltransferase [Colletotrichum paranaense]|uniref:Acetyltransferase n=1 Tax=Colletotrichum paranaense TaxID=1914294 RepID=A0ABQ9SAJ6_9PEZI|nr:acetyltransferase [Colletotrichum paranaense]KAK1531393.1 acetyltransferase [Colletotrichum paranaense]
MDSPHHMGIRELNVSNWHSHNALTDTFNHAVPAIKTSAAFFTFLRANLVLNPSAMSSNTNTPVLQPTVASNTHRPAAPSPLATSQTLDPFDDIPPLSLEVLSTREDKAEALHLVADSIAQQRQQAAYSLVFHPVPLAGLAATLGVAYQYSYARQGDIGLAFTLFSGVIMTYLLAIRWATSGYLPLAEQMSWSFIRPHPDASADEEDLVLGTRFGNELVGALVLHLEPASPAVASTFGSRRRNKASSFRGGKGIIRAWTTKLRYRGKGVGTDMLDEAVRITRERCGKDAEVGFALEHANSRMVMPEFFNGVFRKRERWAAKTLDGVLAERELTKKKR